MNIDDAVEQLARQRSEAVNSQIEVYALCGCLICGRALLVDGEQPLPGARRIDFYDGETAFVCGDECFEKVRQLKVSEAKNEPA